MSEALIEIGWDMAQAEITTLRARIAELEASIADEREDAARAMRDYCASVAPTNQAIPHIPTQQFRNRP